MECASCSFAEPYKSFLVYLDDTSTALPFPLLLGVFKSMLVREEFPAGDKGNSINVRFLSVKIFITESLRFLFKLWSTSLFFSFAGESAAVLFSN